MPSASCRPGASSSTSTTRDELALGLEGGHSSRRIVHSGGSQTGHEITSKLAAMVDAEGRGSRSGSAPRRWRSGATASAASAWSPTAAPIASAATVLATGGAAALWRRTTNPWGAIGAGPVLGAAAGADLADLEFCQFHPTALALPGTPHDGLLITEAVRGEGATLLDASGRRFTDELAPRDAVTAAILARLEADGTPAIKLDLRGIDPARFPNVFSSLAEAGLDPAAEPVPVAPAAHYMMGGIAVDLDGPLLAAGPAGGRRVLLHRPARRQPARLQLAQRVLRLRPPGGRRRARRDRAGRAPGPLRLALRSPDRGDPRRGLAPRRPGPRRRPASSG